MSNISIETSYDTNSWTVRLVEKNENDSGKVYVEVSAFSFIDCVLDMQRLLNRGLVLIDAMAEGAGISAPNEKTDEDSVGDTYDIECEVKQVIKAPTQKKGRK